LKANKKNVNFYEALFVCFTTEEWNANELTDDDDDHHHFLSQMYFWEVDWSVNM
jgi:hypothetical protein